MKQLLAGFMVGVLLGAPGGAFLWYAFSPLFYDDVVTETLMEAEVLQTGTFRNADRAHKGTGTAQLVSLPGGGLEVQFTDFQVTNGPDLEVWLSAHPDPETSTDVISNAWLSLGQLKGNIGNQAYPVPADADISKYSSVVIWCEQFGVLFSPAAFSAVE